jgi:hypothetical protein
MRFEMGSQNTSTRSALLAILALPVLLVGFGAWEAWRGGATRTEYEGLARDQPAHVARLMDEQRRHTDTSIRLPASPDVPAIAAARAQPQTARDGAGIDLLVARAREAIAWLGLLASIAAGLAGAGGSALVSRAACIGVQSRLKLVAVFGRVSRLLPAALGIQIVGAVLAVAAAVTFEVSGLWFTSDPGDNAVLLAILVVGYAGFAVWGGVTTLRRLRLALRSFVPTPLAVHAHRGSTGARSVRHAARPGARRGRHAAGGRGRGRNGGVLCHGIPPAALWGARRAARDDARPHAAFVAA